MKLGIFIVATALVFCSLALAGGEVGNGGNSVVCRDGAGSVTTIELLDYYQYAANLPCDLGPESSAYAEKINFVLDRLAKFDPVRAKNYATEAGEFLKVTRWTPGPLPSVPDSGFVPVPAKCAIEQTAIQYRDDRMDGTRYTIAPELWAKLDGENQAGLTLHEVIYREEIRLGYTDSVKARYFNAVISSDQMDTMDQATYDNLASITFEPVEGVSFSKGEIDETAHAAATSNFDLQTFLAYAGTSPLSWYLIGSTPTWISVDASTGMLTVAPPAAANGTYTLMLVAHEGQDGHAATANLKITVD